MTTILTVGSTRTSHWSCGRRLLEPVSYANATVRSTNRSFRERIAWRIGTRALARDRSVECRALLDECDRGFAARMLSLQCGCVNAIGVDTTSARNKTYYWGSSDRSAFCGPCCPCPSCVSSRLVECRATKTMMPDAVIADRPEVFIFLESWVGGQDLRRRYVLIIL